MTLPGLLPERIFVIDTSSVIEVRRLFSQANRAARERVYERLSQLVRTGSLTFPELVCEELARGHEGLADQDDAPFAWGQVNRGAAVSDAELFDDAKAVLAAAPNLLDRDKTSGADEADPYVVGLALKHAREGRQVAVVADDRNDTPDKTSIQSACGLVGIPAMSMRAFLGHLGIVPPR
jgi:hypothetical protein